MLTDKKQAYMKAKLGLPLVVQDILSGKEEYNEDVQYAIHDLISDMQPDTAALAMTMAAKEIIGKFADPESGVETHLDILNIECTRTFDDLAPTWIKNIRGDDVSEEETLEVLSTLPEDLETLAGLFEYSRTCMELNQPAAAAILEIFHIQARAHALIADQLLEAAEAACALEVSTEIPVHAIEHTPANTGIIINFPTAGL